jgi:ABC-type sugar transport system permease subunit
MPPIGNRTSAALPLAVPGPRRDHVPIYVIIPIFQSMWISFYDWDGLGQKTWIGIGNYVELIDDDTFYTSASRTT